MLIPANDENRDEYEPGSMTVPTTSIKDEKEDTPEHQSPSSIIAEDIPAEGLLEESVSFTGKTNNLSRRSRKRSETTPKKKAQPTDACSPPGHLPQDQDCDLPNDDVELVETEMKISISSDHVDCRPAPNSNDDHVKGTDPNLDKDNEGNEHPPLAIPPDEGGKSKRLSLDELSVNDGSPHSFIPPLNNEDVPQNSSKSFEEDHKGNVDEKAIEISEGPSEVIQQTDVHSGSGPEEILMAVEMDEIKMSDSRRSSGLTRMARTWQDSFVTAPKEKGFTNLTSMVISPGVDANPNRSADEYSDTTSNISYSEHMHLNAELPLRFQGLGSESEEAKSSGYPIGQPKKASSWFMSKVTKILKTDPNRIEFERYIKLCEKTIKEIEERNRRHESVMAEAEELMKTDIQRWQRFANTDLMSMARTYFEHRKLYLESRIERNRVLCELIQENVDACDKVLAGSDIENYRNKLFDGGNSFINPHSLIRKSEGKKLWDDSTMKTMKSCLSHLKNQYTHAVAKATLKESENSRKKAFHTLLAEAYDKRDRCVRSASEENAFYYHEPAIDTQTKFNRLLIDERTKIGEFLNRWRRAVETDERIDLGSAILHLIPYVCSFLVEKYDIPPHFKRCLRLFVDRLLFPRIRGYKGLPVFETLRTKRESDGDAIFTKYCKRLRANGQQDIPEVFRKVSDTPFDPEVVSSNMPYYDAMQAMHDATRFVVPTDILHALLRALRLIHTDGQKYASEKGQRAALSADDLFPIVVFVLTHSRIDDVNTRLGHLERFLPKSVKNFGEVGLTLCLIQAGVQDILRQATEEESSMTR